MNTANTRNQNLFIYLFIYLVLLLLIHLFAIFNGVLVAQNMYYRIVGVEYEFLKLCRKRVVTFCEVLPSI